MIQPLWAGRKSLLAIAAATLALLSSSPARADVANGGFEAGSLAGWTLTGDAGFVGVAEGVGHSGDFGAYFGPEGTASLSQVVGTTAGTTYQVQFWLALDDSAAPNSFSWSWNGVTQAAIVDASQFGYVAYTGTFTAAASSGTLQFDFSNPQSFWRLDDVSVTAVPEPASAVLMALGAAALLGSRGRRRAE